MRLSIVEDDPMLLGNLAILLGGEPGIQLKGTFFNGEDALQVLHNLRSLDDISSQIGNVPEVFLVDLGLPGISGIEFIGKAKKLFPNIEFMAFTVFEDKKTILSAIKAGASGYILKGGAPRELVEALFSLYQGGAPMSPKIARALIAEFRGEAVAEQYVLTRREHEILTFLENGSTYKEIASSCVISPHTVHSHIKNIYEKLHVKNRKEALIMAKKKGIIL